MKEKEIKSVQISEKGSLGLLAYGHKGLIAWRKVVIEAKLKKEKENSKNGK